MIRVTVCTLYVVRCNVWPIHLIWILRWFNVTDLTPLHYILSLITGCIGIQAQSTSAIPASPPIHALCNDTTTHLGTERSLRYHKQERNLVLQDGGFTQSTYIQRTIHSSFDVGKPIPMQSSHPRHLAELGYLVVPMYIFPIEV
ncbi:hypothetical protein ACRALDRAFT_207294 [Sodiomyces alcalophilus JCM 7366]|uniref:uncharacterized protein n=1 Tax=Sodiomyces alcalophilus JCM 7366 TaxID=591952 RepID=UPI0039B4DF7A